METEYLDIVDERDLPTGETAERAEVYSKLLRHRIVHVLIFNSKGEMALQLRSKHKSFMPGAWSTAVGGHVLAGESWEPAAIREFQEELGISTRVSFAFKDVYDDPHNPGLEKFISTFTCTYDGPFHPNPEEVDEVRFFEMQEVASMLKKGEKMHPELAFILRKHYANP